MAKLKNDQYGMKNNEHVWDNFNYLGIGNPNAFIIDIPNESVPLILGLGGDNFL